MKTKLTDFSKSKVLANGNKFSVVFNIESRTEIFDENGKSVDEFLQCESCRSEKVFHDCLLFTEKQHPVTPVFARNGGAIFRSTSKKKNVEIIANKNEMFGGFEVNIKTIHASVCKDMKEFAEEAIRLRRLFASTKIQFGQKHTALIEYPIKTINVSRSVDMAQIDTGPVALPLFEKGKSPLECLHLAHIACFDIHKVNFVIKTEVRECECEKNKIVIFDYGKNVVMDAETSFYYED